MAEQIKQDDIYGKMKHAEMMNRDCSIINEICRNVKVLFR